MWAKIEHNLSTPQSARRIGITTVTLRSWIQGWERDGLALTPRGRPTRDSDAETRHAVTTMLDLFGPEMGVPTLQYLFGSMPKRELDDMIRRYRDTHYEGKRVTVHSLSWQKAGTVWAMDYTAPPNVIEGRYKTILAVRDLASGRLLWAAPAEQVDREVEVDVGGGRQHRDGAQLVPGALELLGPPAGDALVLGLFQNLNVGRGHSCLRSWSP